MKKILAVCFCTVLVSAYSFAEFIISPSVGYSNHFALGLSKIEVSLPSIGTKSVTLRDQNVWHAVSAGVNVGFIGKSGFTFFCNNSVSFIGTLQKKVGMTGVDEIFTLKAQELKGVYWDGELLAGYTFKPMSQLYVTFAGGVGAGGTFSIVPGKLEIAGKPVDTKVTVAGYNIGLALHTEAAFYFTKNIGLALSITETAGYGILRSALNQYNFSSSSLSSKSQLNADRGFVNAFNLKVGPTFKF